jgi:hypothetical protein
LLEVESSGVANSDLTLRPNVNISGNSVALPIRRLAALLWVYQRLLKQRIEAKLAFAGTSKAGTPTPKKRIWYFSEYAYHLSRIYKT